MRGLFLRKRRVLRKQNFYAQLRLKFKDNFCNKKERYRSVVSKNEITFENTRYIPDS